MQGLEEERQMGLLLIDNLKPLNITIRMVPLTWPNMVARGAKAETSPDIFASFSTTMSIDPDPVAYMYHKVPGASTTPRISWTTRNCSR